MQSKSVLYAAVPPKHPLETWCHYSNSTSPCNTVETILLRSLCTHVSCIAHRRPHWARWQRHCNPRYTLTEAASTSSVAAKVTCDLGQCMQSSRPAQTYIMHLTAGCTYALFADSAFIAGRHYWFETPVCLASMYVLALLAHSSPICADCFLSRCSKLTVVRLGSFHR